MQCPPRPGPGLEAHEPERLRRGRVDHLPDVDLHPVAELRELVDERDVDRAEDVLEQLRQLGRLGRGDRVTTVVDRARVELGGRLGRAPRRSRRRPSASSSSCSRCGPGRRARARRRGGSPAPAFRPLPSSRIGWSDLARRPRVGRRLEHDEVALAQVRRDVARGALDVGDVGLALRRERRRHGDHDRVGVGDGGEVGGRGDRARLDERLQRLARGRPGCGSRRG